MRRHSPLRQERKEKVQQQWESSHVGAERGVASTTRVLPKSDTAAAVRPAWMAIAARFTAVILDTIHRACLSSSSRTRGSGY